MDSEPKKKRKIPQAIRMMVWQEYAGKEGEILCFAGCKNKVTPFTFQCGHVESEASGGETSINNLRPVCAECNRSMGTTNMMEFINRHQLPVHPNWDGLTGQGKKPEVKVNYLVSIFRSWTLTANTTAESSSDDEGVCSRCPNKVYSNQLCHKHYKLTKCCTKHCRRDKMLGYLNCLEHQFLGEFTGNKNKCQWLVDDQPCNAEAIYLCQEHLEITLAMLHNHLSPKNKIITLD